MMKKKKRKKETSKLNVLNGPELIAIQPIARNYAV